MERDSLRGTAGAIWIVVNGENRQIASGKNISVSASISRDDFNVIGALNGQYKLGSVAMTGTMTLYQGDPTALRLLYDYVKLGTAPYFTLTIKAADPSATIGRQTIALYDCQLTDLDMVSLDADATFTTQDISFVFTDFEILDEFGQPTTYGTNRVEEW